MIAHIYDPSIWEVEARGLQAHGEPRLYNEFQDNLYHTGRLVQTIDTYYVVICYGDFRAFES